MFMQSGQGASGHGEVFATLLSYKFGGAGYCITLHYAEANSCILAALRRRYAMSGGLERLYFILSSVSPLRFLGFRAPFGDLVADDANGPFRVLNIHRIDRRFVV